MLLSILGLLCPTGWGWSYRVGCILCSPPTLCHSVPSVYLGSQWRYASLTGNSSALPPTRLVPFPQHLPSFWSLVGGVSILQLLRVWGTRLRLWCNAICTPRARSPISEPLFPHPYNGHSCDPAAPHSFALDGPHQVEVVSILPCKHWPLRHAAACRQVGHPSTVPEYPGQIPGSHASCTSGGC